MKRLIVLMCALLLLCSSCSVASPELQKESYLAGWYVDEGVVYIVCHMFVMSDRQQIITMEAYSSEDRGFLLKTGELTAYNEDMSSTSFELHRGRNEFIAVFVGTYGTTEEKADYHIPDNIIIKTKKEANGKIGTYTGNIKNKDRGAVPFR